MAIVRERIGHTDHPYHHVLWYDNLLIKYDRPSYGLVGDADGYSQRAHRPYRSPVPSRFVVRQPSYQIKRACFSKSGGGGGESSIVPFKVGGAFVDSLYVARTASACGQSTV